MDTKEQSSQQPNVTKVLVAAATDVGLESPPLVAAAEVLGTLAFKSGMPCKPALDQEVLKLFARLEVGQGEPIIAAWTRNWNLAQAASENEPALGEQLRDHRYQYRLEQVNLVEAHGNKEQRTKEAVALIREVAMQRVLSKFTVEQETHVLERLYSLVPPKALKEKPPFGLGAYSKTKNGPPREANGSEAHDRTVADTKLSDIEPNQ